jgi:antirestriction protein
MTPLMTPYGEAESEEDFAYGFVEDNGLLNEEPESLRMYFDYEAYARDLSATVVFQRLCFETE